MKQAAEYRETAELVLLFAVMYEEEGDFVDSDFAFSWALFQESIARRLEGEDVDPALQSSWPPKKVERVPGYGTWLCVHINA
jgi:hypothetical protein